MTAVGQCMTAAVGAACCDDLGTWSRVGTHRSFLLFSLRFLPYI